MRVVPRAARRRIHPPRWVGRPRPPAGSRATTVVSVRGQQSQKVQAPGGPGSLRARLRLAAVVLLGLLALTYLGLGVRLYFFPAGEAVASGLVAVVLGLAALTYLLVTRAVIRQSRLGHILAIVVCGLAAVLGVAPGMTWLDWVVFGVNVATAGLLLGCIPRKAAA